MRYLSQYWSDLAHNFRNWSKWLISRFLIYKSILVIFEYFIWLFRFFYVFNRLILHLFLVFFVHFPKCGHNTRSKKNIFFRDDKKRIKRLIYIIETQRRRLLGGHSSQTKKYDSENFLKFMHFLIDFRKGCGFDPQIRTPPPLKFEKYIQRVDGV